ncbi:MAG: ACT domain-containing protein [Candidatus Peregrinibacteria bacterium]
MDFSEHLRKYFETGEVRISPDIFAMVQTSAPVSGAFVNIMDDYECTVILPERDVEKCNAKKISGGWRLFTLHIFFPPDCFGVTATIATALAHKNISIMPIAAYSRDHFLISDKDMNGAKDVFESLGITVVFQ